MVTALTLCGVVALALIVGVATSARPAVTAVVGVVGLAAMIAAFAELIVVRNPGGEGWGDRYQVFGHWVPIWQCNLMEVSMFAWLGALPCAALLYRVWRSGRLQLG
jgi:hypothetical protein